MPTQTHRPAKPHPKPDTAVAVAEAAAEERAEQRALRDVVCMILKEKGHFEHFFAIILVSVIQVAVLLHLDINYLAGGLTGLVLAREFLVFFFIER